MTPEESPIAPEPDAGFAASGMVAALDRISVDVAPVSCAPTLTMSDSELRQGLARASALVAQVQAAYLHLVAVACLGRLPPGLLAHVDEEGVRGIERIDAFLTEHAQRHTPNSLGRITRQLEAVLDPDGQYDPGTYERRHLNMSTDRQGMLIGRFALDPASGTLLRNVIHALSAPHPVTTGTESQGELPLRDERTAEQRRADALTHLAHLALRGANGPDTTTPDTSTHANACPDHAEPITAQTRASATDPDDTDETTADDVRASRGFGQAFFRTPPAPTGVHVTIVATLDQIVAALGEHSRARAGLAADLGPGGGSLDPTTLSRLLCEALISPTLLDGHGAVLAHGRATRLATPAQRRAVFARDRGCVIPGCTTPPHWCDIHHVTPWTEGGLTDVDAMVAACGLHHTALHAGIWTLTMINGVPYAIPPAWLDPTRAPHRNTLHDDESTARHLAQQLTLDLDPFRRRLGNPRAGLSPGASTDEESPP